MLCWGGGENEVGYKGVRGEGSEVLWKYEVINEAGARGLGFRWREDGGGSGGGRIRRDSYGGTSVVVRRKSLRWGIGSGIKRGEMAIGFVRAKKHSEERMGKEDIGVVIGCYRNCVEVRSCIDGA